jgi:heat shock protein HslJ
MKLRVIVIVLATALLQCKTQKSADQPVTIELPALEFKSWKLVEVDGKPVTVPANGQEVYLILTPIKKGSGALKGHAGCNGLGGDYQIHGSSIKFMPITTKMYCEAQMDIENKFTRMLTTANSYRVDGNTLELYSGAELLGKFQTKTEE